MTETGGEAIGESPGLVLVTAADSTFFHRLQGLILSVREKHELRGIAIGVLDVGLTPPEREWLGVRVTSIVRPDWDFDFPRRDEQPETLKAFFARPYLPRHFPGFELYAWFDADTWIQRAEVFSYLARGARQGKLAICPEIDVGYEALYRGGFRNQDWRWHYKKIFGRSERKKWIGRPMLNCGVFALAAGADHWAAWRETLREAVSRRVFSCADQLSLHRAVYSRGLSMYPLPATCNWLSHTGLPFWDVERDLLTTPYPPYEEIGVMHMTTSAADEPDRLFTTTGGEKRMRSRKYRNGRY
jgi:hypothetical protein